LPRKEVVLFFLRDGLDRIGQVHRVLTSVQGAGSHTLAEVFFAAWHQPVEYVHCWPALSTDQPSHDEQGCTRSPSALYAVPADVDAVFVAKDFLAEKTFRGVDRLVQAGFHLASPNIGARAMDRDYLSPLTLSPGDLLQNPVVPAEAVDTYQ